MRDIMNCDFKEHHESFSNETESVIIKCKAFNTDLSEVDKRGSILNASETDFKFKC